jgi:ferredoxin
MSLVPGLGIVKGMGLTLRRFFEPKVTIKYPRSERHSAQVPRPLQLLYDEWGTIKCETCFQCAQACPIECIDMAASTRAAATTSTGAPETYGERREESALRRSGRPVPGPRYLPFAAVDLRELDRILDEFDHDPAEMLPILEATQTAYGYLRSRRSKRISQRTGAWYASIYGTATFYSHLRSSRPASGEQAPPSTATGRPRRPTLTQLAAAARGVRARRVRRQTQAGDRSE